MSTRIFINGTEIDRTGYSLRLFGGDLYGRGIIPNFRFAIEGGTLTGFPTWDNVPVQILENDQVIFAGDTNRRVDHLDPQVGWTREWTCLGLVQRAARIPVTDSLTLTDTCEFNHLPEDGRDYVPSRAGRTVAQIVADILEMDQNASALIGHGIGRYTSSGSGARAHAILAGRTVGSVVIDEGGTGYTTAPTVMFCGGAPTTPATGHAIVSSGVVTGIVVDTAGTGYVSAPVVLLSRLPSETLSDLDGLWIIPPRLVSIGGEQLLQAIESFVQAYHSNHWLHVQPDGTIRFFDPRTWTADITLQMDGSDPRVPKPTLTRDWSECFGRVVFRGDTYVLGQTFDLIPKAGSADPDGGLQEDFAHDGLTNAQAKTAWKASDWNQPGQTTGQATATAATSGGAVTGFTVNNQGYGYTIAPPVLVVGGGGSGAAGTAVLTGDKVTSITLTAGGTGYTTPPTVTLGAPGVGQSLIGTCTMPSTTEVTCTPQGSYLFPADYWDQTETGHQATITLYQDGVPSVTQRFTARVVANTALSYGGTFTITMELPAPAITYTSFQLFGTGGGGGNVWRKYKLSDANLARRLQQEFPYAQAYRAGSDLAAIMVTSPQATVMYSSNGQPPYQSAAVGIAAIDPDGNAIYLAKPSALVFSPNGTTPVTPTNVQMFLPVATGGLSVVTPADVGGVPQYTGTSHAIEGMTETKTVTVREWRDPSNTANMVAWAQELHDTFCDTVVEGDCDYLGLHPLAITPGHKVNITGNGYATGLETIAIPVDRCSLRYNEGPDGLCHATTMGLSNRRAPYSGEGFYRPSQVGLSVGLPEGAQVERFTFEITEEGAEALAAGEKVYRETMARPGVQRGEQWIVPPYGAGTPTRPAAGVRGIPAFATAADFAAKQVSPLDVAGSVPTPATLAKMVPGPIDVSAAMPSPLGIREPTPLGAGPFEKRRTAAEEAARRLIAPGADLAGEAALARVAPLGMGPAPAGNLNLGARSGLGNLAGPLPAEGLAPARPKAVDPFEALTGPKPGMLGVPGEAGPGIPQHVIKTPDEILGRVPQAKAERPPIRIQAKPQARRPRDPQAVRARRQFTPQEQAIIEAGRPKGTPEERAAWRTAQLRKQQVMADIETRRANARQAQAQKIIGRAPDVVKPKIIRPQAVPPPPNPAPRRPAPAPPKPAPPPEPGGAAGGFGGLLNP